MSRKYDTDAAVQNWEHRQREDQMKPQFVYNARQAESHRDDDLHSKPFFDGIFELPGIIQSHRRRIKNNHGKHSILQDTKHSG